MPWKECSVLDERCVGCNSRGASEGYFLAAIASAIIFMLCSTALALTRGASSRCSITLDCMIDAKPCMFDQMNIASRSTAARCLAPLP